MPTIMIFDRIGIKNGSSGSNANALLRVDNNNDTGIYVYSFSTGYNAYGGTDLYNAKNSVIYSTSSTKFVINTTYSTTPIIFATAGHAATDEKMRIEAGGNVGIGTTSPASILHTVASGAKTAAYSGNLFTNTSTSSTASIRKTGLEITSTGTWNGTSASNVGLYVSSVTGGTNNYDAIFNGGGNVGVGTTTPAGLLSVGDGAAAGGYSLILNGGTNSGAGVQIAFQRGGSSKGWIGTDSYIQGGTSDKLSII